MLPRPVGCRPGGRGVTAAGTGDRGPGIICDGNNKFGGDGVSIEIANESGVEVDEAALAGLARHVLDEMRVHPLAELSVLLVDESAMTELHVRWMGEEGSTDVLAFPMDELRPPQPGGMHAEHGPSDPPEIAGLLGDVVICPQVAAAQARRARHDVQGEIDLLCTHGILHLLGYDHADAREHATMFGLQDRLLASWRAESAAAADPDGGHADGEASGYAGDQADGHAIDGPAASSADSPSGRPAERTAGAAGGILPDDTSGGHGGSPAGGREAPG